MLKIEHYRGYRIVTTTGYVPGYRIWHGEVYWGCADTPDAARRKVDRLEKRYGQKPEGD